MKIPFLSPTGVVYCDSCGRRMNLKLVKIEGEDLTNDRVGYFFCCPHCRVKYPFASLTKRGNALLQNLKMAREDVKKAVGNKKQYPIVVRKYEKLLKKYQKEVGGPYSDEEVVVND